MRPHTFWDGSMVVMAVGCVLIAMFGIIWWDAATCEERGPERPYVESCGKDCVHTVYRSECIRRKP